MTSTPVPVLGFSTEGALKQLEAVGKRKIRGEVGAGEVHDLRVGKGGTPGWM